MSTVLDPNNKLSSLRVDPDGKLQVAGSFAADPPVGAATEAKQDLIVSGLAAVAANQDETIGPLPVSQSVATVSRSGGYQYKPVAAGATNFVLGPTGAAGDYLEGLHCVVTDPANCAITIKDGAGAALPAFPNNVASGINAYYLSFGYESSLGAWQVSTGSGVTVIAGGKFT